jgi:para-nitrobenzyl esterase
MARDGEIANIFYMVGHTDEILLDAPVTTMDSYEAWLNGKFGADADRMRALFSIHSEVDLLRLRPNSIRGGLIAASHTFCHRNSELGRKPSYYYYFRHRLPGDDLGAFHGGELWYFFHQLHRCWRPFDGYDHRLADLCTEYFMNFVKNGNPNGDGLPHWSPNTGGRPAVMILDNPVRQQIGVENAGFAHWIHLSQTN